jgi:cephalosporin-C deacetylase
MISLARLGLPLLLAGTLAVSVALAEPTITVTPEKKSAVYALGEPIVWDVKVENDSAGTLTTASYDLKKGGGTDIGHGTLNIQNGAATIQSSMAEPGTILAEVTTPNENGKKGIRALAGAAVAWDKIDRSAPRPDDFDSFWKAKLAMLAAIPPNAVMVKGDSGRPGVDYWTITFDNINGTHVHGQLARPSGDAKAPAMLQLQYAGVYPLPKKNVVDRAAEGWMALDIMAHDLPLDQPQAFYDEQKNNELKNYVTFGDTDRDKSYFLRMFLGDIQAAEYLAKRPDWNGKVLMVTGASQGGMQSFATAALDPDITAMLVCVPAGCDDSGALVGRKPGWPFYLANPTTPEQKLVLQTSAYFDPVNFASEIKCPALVGLGLIDETATPSGVLTAFNQLTGPKQVLIMPDADHHGDHGTQAPFWGHAGTWQKAFLDGQSAPVEPNPKP